MARVVIADAGPLIALAKLDALPLLGELFGSVLVPAAVHDECMAKDTLDSRRIGQAVEMKLLRIEPGIKPLPQGMPVLGEGEQQALSLALSLPQSLLILDDRLARRQATRLHLAFIGTVRLLHIAEQHGLIENTERLVEHLCRSGYRISPEILKWIREEGR